MIQQNFLLKNNLLIQLIISFFTRMFENRIEIDGSAYLAEPYSPTSVHCRQDKPAQYFKSCAHDYLYFRVFDALSSELLGFIL